MKRAAYYALHYGKEYLAWSIRSVQDAVDEIIVLYTDRPSFGHDTPLTCPDTEAELEREARRFLKKPLVWIRGRWGGEGQHRTEILKIAAERGIGQLLVVDADELWHPDQAARALDLSAKRTEANVLVRFVHFWRSLGWVCNDPCMPVRVLNVGGHGTWYLSPQEWPVLHFGYAQSLRLTRYKLDIHGHKAELRPGWMDHKFSPWTPLSGMKDVHPTNANFWDPVQTDERTRELVVRLLGDHPYMSQEVIE